MRLPYIPLLYLVALFALSHALPVEPGSQIIPSSATEAEPATIVARVPQSTWTTTRFREELGDDSPGGNKPSSKDAHDNDAQSTHSGDNDFSDSATLVNSPTSSKEDLTIEQGKPKTAAQDAQDQKEQQSATESASGPYKLKVWRSKSSFSTRYKWALTCKGCSWKDNILEALANDITTAMEGFGVPPLAQSPDALGALLTGSNPGPGKGQGGTNIRKGFEVYITMLTNEKSFRWVTGKLPPAAKKDKKKWLKETGLPTIARAAGQAGFRSGSGSSDKKTG